MAKERVAVFLEPSVLKRLRKVFPGITDGAAAATAVEFFLENKDYSEWSLRTAVISRATMTMLAEITYPNDTTSQEQFMKGHIAKADYWLRRRMREEKIAGDSTSEAVQKPGAIGADNS